MGIMQWLRSRFNRTPRNLITEVRCENQVIELTWRDGTTNSVAVDDLYRVLIVTTDCGPYDDDVFFVIQTVDVGYIIPHGLAVDGELLECLQKLPDFDNEAVVRAMGSVENEEFLCWQKA